MPLEKDQKDNIVKSLHVRVMDFKTNNAANLEICLSKLSQMFDNLLHHPETEKFRQVRASNPTFKKTVLDAVKHIEDFLRSAGWKTKVQQLEKYWGFDALPGSTAWMCLECANQELQSAMQLLKEKAERHAKEQSEHKIGPSRERDRVVAQLEADKLARVFKQTSRPSERGTPSKGAQSPGPQT